MNPLKPWQIEDSIHERFPELLTWYDESIDGYHCAGLCVPPGWYALILQLLEEVQAHVSETGEDAPVFRDFKDKRGYLSVIYDGGSNSIDDLIFHFEDKALITCPSCGAYSPKGDDCELCTRRQRKPFKPPRT